MQNKQAEIPADAAQAVGRQLTENFLLGTGIGAGGTGLLYLLRKMKKKVAPPQQSLGEFATTVNLPEQKIAQYGSPSATMGYGYIPERPPSPAPSAGKNMSFMPSAAALALPIGGAGVGALIGAIRSKPGRRLRDVLRGATVGGLVGGGGAMLTAPAVQEGIGQAATDLKIPGFFDAVSGGWGPKRAPEIENNLSNNQKAVLTLASILSAGGGAYLGNSAVNALTEKNDEEKQRDAVANSRDEYFAQLLGQEQKTAVDAELDKLYDEYEKRGFVNSLLEGYTLSKGLAGLGAAGLAAKYMYDKTKAKSDSKLLSAARAARQRMQMAETPWVNPVELAQIKELAQQNASANQQGG